LLDIVHSEADLKKDLNLNRLGPRKRLKRMLEQLEVKGVGVEEVTGTGTGRRGAGEGSGGGGSAAGAGVHEAFAWTPSQVAKWAGDGGFGFLASWIQQEEVDGTLLVQELDPDAHLRDVFRANTANVEESVKKRGEFARALKVLRGRVHGGGGGSGGESATGSHQSGVALGQVLEAVLAANADFQQKLNALKKKYAGMDVPEDYKCPITLEVMEDPVLATDGETYERNAIQAWIDLGNLTSPRQGVEVPILRTLFPNLAIRRAIQTLLDSGDASADLW
jgi:hypothetical protein